MTTAIIVLLILLGLFLLVMEFFVIPGITFAGIGGVIFVGAGIFMAYKNYGNTGGNIALVLTFLLSISVVFWSLRSGTWKRLMLDSEVDGSVEVKEEESINEGDEGLSITRLNPVGKVSVNGVVIEAHCPGHFVDQNTPLVVTKVFKTYIIVKPKI